MNKYYFKEIINNLSEYIIRFIILTMALIILFIPIFLIYHTSQMLNNINHVTTSYIIDYDLVEEGHDKNSELDSFDEEIIAYLKDNDYSYITSEHKTLIYDGDFVTTVGIGNQENERTTNLLDSDMSLEKGEVLVSVEWATEYEIQEGSKLLFYEFDPVDESVDRDGVKPEYITNSQEFVVKGIYETEQQFNFDAVLFEEDFENISTTNNSNINILIFDDIRDELKSEFGSKLNDYELIESSFDNSREYFNSLYTTRIISVLSLMICIVLLIIIINFQINIELTNRKALNSVLYENGTHITTINSNNLYTLLLEILISINIFVISIDKFLYTVSVFFIKLVETLSINISIGNIFEYFYYFDIIQFNETMSGHVTNSNTLVFVCTIVVFLIITITCFIYNSIILGGDYEKIFNVFLLILVSILIIIYFLSYESNKENEDLSNKIEFDQTNLVDNPLENPPRITEELYSNYAENGKFDGISIIEPYIGPSTFGFEQDNVVLLKPLESYTIDEGNESDNMKAINYEVEYIECLQGTCPGKDLFSAVFIYGNVLSTSIFNVGVEQGYIYIGAYNDDDEYITEFYPVDIEKMQFLYYDTAYDQDGNIVNEVINIDDFLKKEDE